MTHLINVIGSIQKRCTLILAVVTICLIRGYANCTACSQGCCCSLFLLLFLCEFFFSSLSYVHLLLPSCMYLFFCLLSKHLHFMLFRKVSRKEALGSVLKHLIRDAFHYQSSLFKQTEASLIFFRKLKSLKKFFKKLSQNKINVSDMCWRPLFCIIITTLRNEEKMSRILSFFFFLVLFSYKFSLKIESQIILYVLSEKEHWITNFIGFAYFFIDMYT